SMSFIATVHTRGPSKIAVTITLSITRLMRASRWRQKRSQASRAAEKGRIRTFSVPLSSIEGNAGIKPAIKDVRDKVENHNEAGEDERYCHDDRSVVGEDRTDQQGSDSWNAENLFRDDSAAEYRWHLQSDQRHHRYERISRDMPDNNAPLAQPLG